MSRTRSDVIVLYFAHLKCALALLYYISACGGPVCKTCSRVVVLFFPYVEGPRMDRALTLLGFIVLYFPRVERTLGLLCYIFGVWNALWRHCVIFYTRGGPARGTGSGIMVLYFSHVDGPCVECTLTLLCYIIRTWMACT